LESHQSGREEEPEVVALQVAMPHHSSYIGVTREREEEPGYIERRGRVKPEQRGASLALDWSHQRERGRRS
jgi:hypothetical protein